jgi:hypothetical protein
MTVTCGERLFVVDLSFVWWKYLNTWWIDFDWESLSIYWLLKAFVSRILEKKMAKIFKMAARCHNLTKPKSSVLEFKPAEREFGKWQSLFGIIVPPTSKPTRPLSARTVRL